MLILQEYTNDKIKVSFSAERAIEDEISESSFQDLYTVFISYALMFM